MIARTAIVVLGALGLGLPCAAEDPCGGNRCDTQACPCGCECGNDHDPGLCYVPQRAQAGLVPTTMKAAQGNGQPCDKPDWSCISEKDVPVPKPGAGEVLLEMRGSSVNPIDVDLVEPSCKNFPKPFTCSNGTIGDDGAGIVVALGSGCSDLKVGDEVWGFMDGSYAQYAIAKCKRVGLKPTNLGFVNAGTIPVVGGTSLQCLQAAGMPSKKSNLTVVITSGQGGTGFIGIQLAKALGATRVITAATGAGIEFVKALGADVVVDYHKQDLSESLATDSVDIVYDNLGLPGTADKIMHSIRSGGTFLVLTGGEHGSISKHPKKGVKQIHFGSSIFGNNKKEMNQLKGLFEAGKLQSRTMHQTYGLREIPSAFTRLRSSGVLGKIAIVPTKTTTLTVV